MLLCLLDLLTVAEPSGILWLQSKFLWATRIDRPVYFLSQPGVQTGERRQNAAKRGKICPHVNSRSGPQRGKPGPRQVWRRLLSAYWKKGWNCTQGETRQRLLP